MRAASTNSTATWPLSIPADASDLLQREEYDAVLRSDDVDLQ